MHADAWSVAGTVELVYGIDWPLGAVKMVILDAEGGSLSTAIGGRGNVCVRLAKATVSARRRLRDYPYENQESAPSLALFIKYFLARSSLMYFGTVGSDNLIRQAVQAACPDLTGEFEVIVDYKGTRRPDTGLNEWTDGEWQVRTLGSATSSGGAGGWPQASSFTSTSSLRVKAIFLALRAALGAKRTDVGPVRDSDQRMLENWRPGARPEFSPEFLFRRAVRVIPVDDQSVLTATGAFDETVSRIETCVRQEEEAVSILQTWLDDCGDAKTCAALRLPILLRGVPAHR